jgi:cold shock protein
MPPI